MYIQSATLEQIGISNDLYQELQSLAKDGEIDKVKRLLPIDVGVFMYSDYGCDEDGDLIDRGYIVSLVKVVEGELVERRLYSPEWEYDEGFEQEGE